MPTYQYLSETLKSYPSGLALYKHKVDHRGIVSDEGFVIDESVIQELKSIYEKIPEKERTKPLSAEDRLAVRFIVHNSYDHSSRVLRSHVLDYFDREIRSKDKNVSVEASKKGVLNGQYTPDPAEVAKHSDANDLRNAIVCLREVGILTKDIFDIVKSSWSIDSAVRVVIGLKRANLLTPENIQSLKAVSNDYHFRYTIFSIEYIAAARILTQQNFDLIIKRTYTLDELSHAFGDCYKYRILSQTHFDLLIKKREPRSFGFRLTSLYREGICTPKFVDILDKTKDKKSSGLCQAFIDLHKVGMLTDFYIEEVKNHKRPEDLARAISALVKSNLFNETNYNKTKEYISLSSLDGSRLSSIMRGLSEKGYLTQLTFDNLHIIPLEKRPGYYPDGRLEDLQWVLTCYHGETTLLDSHDITDNAASDNKNTPTTRLPFLIDTLVVNRYKKPKELFSITFVLKHAGILNKENFETAKRITLERHMSSRNCESLASAGILTQTNFDFIVSNSDNENLVYFLDREKILNQANFDVIRGNPAPRKICGAISTLFKCEILTDANREAIKNQVNFNILFQLESANLLNQERFNQIIQFSNILLTARMDAILSHIPHHQMNLAIYNQIIEICRQAQGNVEQAHVSIWNQVVRLLNPQQPALRVREFNPGQSTHTASVHRTASESAVRLKKSYGNQLSKDFENKIKEIKEWAKTFGHTPEDEVARRGVEYFTKDTYMHIDPVSGVSTRELIVLDWIAIHDDQRRIGSLEDAKNCFKGAFLQGVREYNQDENPADQGEGRDKTTCAGGGFNLFVVKMVGVHPDAEIIFMTETTAIIKFTYVIADETLKYLASCPEKERVALIRQILEDKTPDAVWDKIKDKASQIIDKEFSPLFQGKAHEFPDFIDAGVYREFDEKFLTNLKNMLSQIEDTKKIASSPTPQPPQPEQQESSNLEPINLTNQTLRVTVIAEVSTLDGFSDAIRKLDAASIADSTCPDFQAGETVSTEEEKLNLIRAILNNDDFWKLQIFGPRCDFPVGIVSMRTLVEQPTFKLEDLQSIARSRLNFNIFTFFSSLGRDNSTTHQFYNLLNKDCTTLDELRCFQAMQNEVIEEWNIQKNSPAQLPISLTR